MGKNANKATRTTLYYDEAEALQNRKYYLNEEPGMKAITAFLPPDLDITATDEGYAIQCPDGTLVTELIIGRFHKKPLVTYMSPSTKKTITRNLELLYPEKHMKITAYCFAGESGREKWSIHKCTDAIPVSLYLPVWTKLIEEGTERYIEFPETDGEMKTFSDRRKLYVPNPAPRKDDFDGTANDGLPFIQYGQKNRRCYLVEEGDIYDGLPMTRTITRLEDTLWRVDTLRREKTSTHVITRIYCNDIRPYELERKKKTVFETPDRKL